MCPQGPESCHKIKILMGEAVLGVGRLGASLGQAWGRPGAGLGQAWGQGRPGAGLGPAWGRPGAGLVQAWGKPGAGLGAGLGQAWGRPGAGLGQGWGKPGANLGQAWCRPGAGPGQAWGTPPHPTPTLTPIRFCDGYCVIFVVVSDVPKSAISMGWARVGRPVGRLGLIFLKKATFWII